MKQQSFICVQSGKIRWGADRNLLFSGEAAEVGVLPAPSTIWTARMFVQTWVCMRSSAPGFW